MYTTTNAHVCQPLAHTFFDARVYRNVYLEIIFGVDATRCQNRVSPGFPTRRHLSLEVKSPSPPPHPTADFMTKRYRSTPKLEGRIKERRVHISNLAVRMHAPSQEFLSPESKENYAVMAAGATTTRHAT